MTRAEAENAVKNEVWVTDFLRESVGIVKGWHGPDTLYVRWENDAFWFPYNYEDLSIAEGVN